MKQFNNTAILTSKNPEAFLNYTHDSSDYWIIPYCDISEGYLYVNGIDVTKYEVSLGYALVLDSTFNVASFHIYTPKNNKFDATLTFDMFDSAGLTSGYSEDVSVLNRPFIISTGAISSYTNDDLLVDDEASYMLMRTNPKFTGNIVINVDCSNNIFLDTIKVSDILSNKKYRHQQISANSVLSSDIRNVFSSMPLGELYRVDVDDTLNIAIPKTEYKNQYNTTYNYGARLLRDELYVEDNGVLAPLWINSKLPDYFAIFRLDGVYNKETYDGSALTYLAEKYLEESSLIKSWSFKPETPLGKYLQTHLNDSVRIQAPLFLSLTDPDLKDAESDPNTWYGVAVDKGVLTGRSETPYFFNQNADNFTDLNAFVSQGFERNTLLCPNLLNLQFIFSDEGVDLYSMSRYFGFYLTENVLYNVAYYSDSSGGPIEIISLDGKDSSAFFNSFIFDGSGNIIDDYKNRIFVLNDEVQLQRITNVNQINDTTWNSYVSKPYKNLFSAEVEKTNIQPFITLTFNNTLTQGEHLRLINKTQNKIWEVYSVDSSAFPCERYCTISENSGYPTVYRTYFDINGDVDYQCEEVCEAFDRFADYEGTYFRCGLHGSNWVSLILNDDACTGDEWVFQRIAAPTLNDFDDPSSGFNTASAPEDITFFGRFIPNASDFELITYDASYGPIDFELYGDRQSIMLNLINREENNLYSFEPTQDILDKFEEPTLYQGTDLWYRRLLSFDVSNNSYQYVKDPLSFEDRMLLMTGYEVQTVKNKINTYSIYPLNISLMGINSVKDIDYTVYDSSTLNYKSEYNYNRECDISAYMVSISSGNSYVLDIPGSFVVQSGTGTIYQDSNTRDYSVNTLCNTFDSSILFTSTTDTIVTYAVLDGSYNYKGYKSNVSEENIWDYYDSSTELKYGLTIPLVAKWVGLGSDCRNNLMRLILNDDVLDVSTNFIPDGSSFTQEISYPSFKYLTACGRTWQDYIFYDINDVIYDGNEYYTFKELMFKYPYVDYFSKLMYSNYGVDSTKTRSSIVYYNQYKNTLDVIFMGLNLSIKAENIAKNILDIKNYDRYRFSFMSTPSRNKDNKRPIEVIINENTKTILMIWYQGNDELNYNMRYSSFLPGKSLLDPSDYGFVHNVSTYSFVKTPYFVRNDTIAKTIEKFYSSDSTYSNETGQPYAQLNKGLVYSSFNAFGNNTITGSTFNVENISSVYKNYETFLQYVDYIYAQNANTYGDYVVNYGYNYKNNKNWYVNNTCNLTTLKYLLSTSFNYVMYYILRGDQLYDSYDFGTNINPITITINPPRTYMGMSTYNGWFKPKFNSILEFKSDEEPELIGVVERDFVFSNTNLRLYNDIPQLWYNKLTDAVTIGDISTGNAISYVNNFNVFKALWDNDYYIKDSAYVDGYQSPDELPSFFGSKLPKFPDSILLEKWDITTASYAQTTNEITLSYNLTRAVLNMFKQNGAFLSNWSAFTDTDNVIDAYIKNTVLTYYNISQPKIGVNYYYKSLDSQLMHYTLDSSDFINDNKQNFNGQLAYVNDEYIYKITIPKTGNFSYFISFTLTEK